MSDPIVLSWDANTLHLPWSKQLLASISENLTQLEQGNPEGFISGYITLNSDLKLKFWAEVIIAIAYFESEFDPHCIYHEPASLGVDSIGLLQLSYEDQLNYHLESLDRNAKSLEDPLVNLRCGVKILTMLISHDHVIAQSTGDAHKGAPRYWSVMRTGSKHHLEDIRNRVKKALGLA